MKKSWTLLILSTLIATGWIGQGEAAVVVLEQPGVTYTTRQPIQATVVDGNGKSFEQTVYYDPAQGGIDLDTSWAGPNASVYFPTLNTGYVWYNGYWVNPSGNYWNAGKRYNVGPEWNTYWTGYWGGRHGGWHDNNWHGGEWHGNGWHGNEWHGGGEWHGEGARGGEWHGDRGGAWHGEGARGGAWRGDDRGWDRGGHRR